MFETELIYAYHLWSNYKTFCSLAIDRVFQLHEYTINEETNTENEREEGRESGTERHRTITHSRTIMQTRMHNKHRKHHTINAENIQRNNNETWLDGYFAWSYDSNRSMSTTSEIHNC